MKAGLSIYNLFDSLMGWEHFEAAQARGKVCFWSRCTWAIGIRAPLLINEVLNCRLSPWPNRK